MCAWEIVGASKTSLSLRNIARPFNIHRVRYCRDRLEKGCSIKHAQISVGQTAVRCNAANSTTRRGPLVYRSTRGNRANFPVLPWGGGIPPWNVVVLRWPWGVHHPPFWYRACYFTAAVRRRSSIRTPRLGRDRNIETRKGCSRSICHGQHILASIYCDEIFLYPTGKEVSFDSNFVILGIMERGVINPSSDFQIKNMNSCSSFLFINFRHVSYLSLSTSSILYFLRHRETQ